MINEESPGLSSLALDKCTVKLTAYTQANLGGKSSAPFTINFDVIDNDVPKEETEETSLDLPVDISSLRVTGLNLVCVHASIKPGDTVNLQELPDRFSETIYRRW